MAEIALKGKIRTILLPTKLCRKLLKYAKKRNIRQGQIFLTKKGNGLSRKFIWAEILSDKSKVFRTLDTTFHENSQANHSILYSKARPFRCILKRPVRLRSFCPAAVAAGLSYCTALRE